MSEIPNHPARLSAIDAIDSEAERPRTHWEYEASEVGRTYKIRTCDQRIKRTLRTPCKRRSPLEKTVHGTHGTPIFARFVPKIPN